MEFLRWVHVSINPWETIAEINYYATTLMYIALSKLILGGWSHWFQMLHGVTYHTGVPSTVYV